MDASIACASDDSLDDDAVDARDDSYDSSRRARWMRRAETLDALVDASEAADASARESAARIRRGMLARARDAARDGARDEARRRVEEAVDALCDGSIDAEAIVGCGEMVVAWCDARARVEAEREAAAREAAAREAARAREAVEGGLGTGDVAKAAIGARDALRMIRRVGDAQRDADADAREAIRAFRARAEDELAAAIRATATELDVDGERLATIVEHLSILDDPSEMRERLGGASRRVFREFLEPMIRAGATRATEVVVDGDALRYKTTDRSPSSDPFTAQACLETTLRWIREKLSSDDVAKDFGAAIWEDVAQTCVSAWLSDHPTERAIDRTCTVEAVASSCGFVPPPPDGAAAYAGGALGPLEARALATELREMETRRAAVLARARDLAINDDQIMIRTAGKAGARGLGLGAGDETATSELSALLDGPPRTISRAADLLSAHVDDVLKTAAELDPNARRAATNLATAAAECLDLFRACVSAARAEQLKTIHVASLVFYNDCHHLANRFSSSVFARGAALERRIGQPPALFWVVEPLRSLADVTRAMANERAMGELHSALDVAAGFLQSAEIQARKDIGKAIDRARNVIRRVGTASMYLLPHPEGIRDAAELASHYARRVVLEILSMDDISVEESEALTEIIASAFSSEGLVGARDDEEASRALLQVVGSEWEKARELGVMLSAPLRDITAAWERGRLRELGFTASEIRGFIGALFSETPLRAECLEKVR